MMLARSSTRLTTGLILCLATGLATTLSGCSLGPPRHAQTTYVLSLTPTTVAATPTTPRWPGTLLVGDMAVANFYLSPALAFSHQAGTRGHYQYAAYTDPPGTALGSLIRQRLAESGLFQAVAANGEGVTGNWQLNLRLLDFYHDASQAPGSVQLSFDADLVDRATARLLAHKHIEASAPAHSFDAQGAAAAANLAVASGIDQLALWLHEAR